MASNERVGITLDILPGTFAGVTAALGGFNELVAATSQFSTAIANSTSVMDAMILNVGVALVGAAWESAKAFGELERGMKITQAVSGQTSSQISILTQKANEFSVKYKLGIDDITAGLQTLGRAGLSNVNTQMDTMQAGLQAAKVEGMALNDALEKIVSTTTLLGGDLNSANFGKQAEKLTSQLLSTSMSAPIDVNDVVQTLSYSGGTAAAAGINIQNDDALYDYLGAISAFAQKGVKGSMAGTAMRAFFTKPASQDTSVIEAFNTLKMKPSDLWKDGGNAMRPISEQIGIIHEQMEKLNMSTLDQIELWGKIVGPKMGQQMMKLDEDTIKAASREIRQTSSATELANMTMDNFLSDIETLEQKSQRAWRGYGEAALAWIGPVVKGLNGLFDILGADIGGIPVFQQFVKMGIIIVISQVIQKLGAVKNLFVGIYQEMRNMLGTMSRSERTIEEQAVAEQKRLQTLGLTKDQAESLVSSESRVTGGLKTSNEVLAQFLVKLNEAVTLMSELATLSRSASMNVISNISTAQHNRAFMKNGTEGMRKTAWFDGLKGGDLTRNEFATLALRHGMSVEGQDGLLSIYKSSEFQNFWRNNQSDKSKFATAISLEKYLQENQKGLYDPKSNPIMGIVSNIDTNTNKIAINTRSQPKTDKTGKTIKNTSEIQGNQERAETQKSVEEKKKQNAKEKEKTTEKNKQNTLEKELTEIDEWCVQQAQAHANSLSQGKTNTDKVANAKTQENNISNRAITELNEQVSQEAIINNALKKENAAHEQTISIINQYNAELNTLRESLSIYKRFRAGNGVASNTASMTSPMRSISNELINSSGIKNLKQADIVRAVNGDAENAKSQQVREVLDRKIAALESDIGYIEARLPNLRREDREIRQSIELLENEKNLSLTKLDIARQQNQSKEKEYLSQQEVNSLYDKYISYLNNQINKVSGQGVGFGGTFTTRNANRRTGPTREVDKNIVVPQNARYLQDLRSQKSLVMDPATMGDAQALRNAIKTHKMLAEEALEYVQRELKELSEDVQIVEANKIEKQKLVEKSKREQGLANDKIQKLEQTKALLLEEQATLQAKISKYRAQYDMAVFNAAFAPKSKQTSYAKEAIGIRDSSELAALKADLKAQKIKIQEVNNEIDKEKRELHQIENTLKKENTALQQALADDEAITNEKHQLKYAILKNTELNNELSTLYNLETALEREVLSAYDAQILALQNNIAKHNQHMDVMAGIVVRTQAELTEKQEALNAMRITRDILVQQNVSEEELFQLDKEILTLTRDVKSLKSRLVTGETRINEIATERSIAEQELLAATQNAAQATKRNANLIGSSGALNGVQLNAMQKIIGQTTTSPLVLPSGLSSSALATIYGVNGTTTTMYNKYGLSDDRVERLKHFGRLRARSMTENVTPMIDPGPIKTTNEEYKKLQKNLNNVNQYYTKLDNVNRKNTSQAYKNLGLTRYSISTGLGATTDEDSVRALQVQADKMNSKPLSAAPGFYGSMRKTFVEGFAQSGRYIEGGGKFWNWMNMGMTGMVDWEKIREANVGLSTLGKVSSFAGGALGSLGMMLGPFEIGMMGLSLVMQGVQAAQQKYKEELEKINSQLSEARENFDKAEEAFLGAYEEQNPKATQDQKDEALLNLYANGPGDRNDGLDSYRTQVYAALCQIEINTRKKAEKENDFWQGSQGGMQKHFWSQWDEFWGITLDNENQSIKNELDNEFAIALESAKTNKEFVPRAANNSIASGADLEKEFNKTLGFAGENYWLRLDDTDVQYKLNNSLDNYANWIDDLEDYTSQAKYSMALMTSGMDSTGVSGGSEITRTYGAYNAKMGTLSDNGIADYKAFENSLSKIPDKIKTQIADSINMDPDFYKSMQRQMFTFKDGKLQRVEGKELKVLQAISKKAGHITNEQAKQTLILSTLGSIHDFVQNNVQPQLLANVEAAMQSANTLGLTYGTGGYTGSATSAVHQGVMVISSQLVTLIEQKSLETMSLLAQSTGIEFGDLTDLARAYDSGHLSPELMKSYDMKDASQARSIVNTMQGMYTGVMTTTGWNQEDAYKRAEELFSNKDNTGLWDVKTINGQKFMPEIPDMFRTFEPWAIEKLTPYIEEQWVKNNIDTTGEASGPTDTGKDKDKSKDSSKDANKKNWVNLAICNKKEIPKLNVNLFKKPPNFTILNRNFKLRDVNVNTADDAKSIQNAVKNSIIEIQNRSNPKIIQDDAAEYNPLAATEGNNLPTGTKKTE